MKIKLSLQGDQMSEDNDYTWGKERVTDTEKMGTIVTIPLNEPDSEFKNKDMVLERGKHTDIFIDEFKEKVAKVLSQKLHKNDS
jgi:hypothetical protein